MRVMLFLGGLLTVGFLYGGQAHAAEATDPVPAPPVSADAKMDVAPSAGPAPAWELRRVAADSVNRVNSVDSVDSVDSVKSFESRQPVEPVRSVRQAAKPVADDAVTHVVRPLLEPLPPPLTPPVNGQLPVPLTPPADGGDEGRTPQLPDDRPVDESAARPTAEHPGGLADPGGWPGMAVTTFQPVGGYDTAAVRQRAEVRSAQPLPAPAQVPGKPCDSTHGALQQSSETHTPRKCEQHAATSAYARPFALVPGAGWAAGDEPTRESARDILEFPG